MKETTGYHETRLAFDARREVLWKTLCAECFQRLIAPDACVLELGAGAKLKVHRRLPGTRHRPAGFGQ